MSTTAPVVVTAELRKRATAEEREDLLANIAAAERRLIQSKEHVEAERLRVGLAVHKAIRRGLSTSEIAASLGYAPPTIARWRRLAEQAMQEAVARKDMEGAR